MEITVNIPHINELRHEFIYALVYTTFDRKPRLLAYQPSGIYVIRLDVDDNHVFRSHDAVIMQFAERPEQHNLLTYSAVFPIRKVLSQSWFVAEFVDTAQPADAVRIAASVIGHGNTANWKMQSGMSTDELFLHFSLAVSAYQQAFDRLLGQMPMIRNDLASLLLTTYTHRLTWEAPDGRSRFPLEFPNVAFFNVSRDPPVAPRILNYLLLMGCHYVGISLATFQIACAKMSDHNKSKDEITANQVLMDTAVEVINFGCSVPSLMTPYGYDDFVNGKDGSVHHGERFSNMRIPARLLRNMADDCEEEGKQNATLLYYTKNTVLSEEQRSQYPFLASAQGALIGAVPASSLMLVKAANVDEAARTVTEIVPVDKTTGHMCGLHLRNMENAVKDGRFLLVDDANNKLNAVYFLEGTGNVRSDILPFTPAVSAVNKMLQARVHDSPLRGFGQRMNMTRCPTMQLHNPLFTPNNFYVTVDTVYPIHERVEDAAVYVCCSSEGMRGAPVADIVAGGGAYLQKMPSPDDELKGLLETMMDFCCPEFELTLTPIDPKVVSYTESKNGLMKKVDMDQSDYLLSLMMNFHKITDDRWDEIIDWIHAQPDIVFSDAECFGNLFDTPVVIIRLFFKENKE